MCRQNNSLSVIGIPICSGNLGGVDALLSTVQMPSGIPVAAVAVNGAVNAALLCVQMFAIEDDDLAKALAEKRANDKIAVIEKNKKIEEEFNKKEI
jgi:5-(carboxyamino)imidazole ribonucleotide mutase